MTIDFSMIISNTISGIIINLPWFILIYLGFKLIAKEIKEGVKNIPSWIEQYFKLQRHQLMINKATENR